MLPFEIFNSQDIEKPWIVLINGLFATRQSWSASIPELARDYRVLSYDGRGQGEGPRPLGPYLLEDLVNDLAHLLFELGIHQATLLGISNGGRIALEFGRLYPGKVEAIIACDTYAEVGPILKMKISSWKEANRIGGPTHRFDVATPWIWAEKTILDYPELLKFYRERAHLEKLHVIEALIDGSMQGEIALEEIKVPVLFVCGEEDVLTPPYMHQQMEMRVKNSDLIMIKGAHASVLENPLELTTQVIPRLKAFLKQSHVQRELLFVDSENLS
ncbi:MAG: hypothetical protein COV37_12840 [Bdellovibrio sp. CG11_big_fil_rev_8_21_14_0_20_39_38]|nr:MAG: hypothetical protein COW78_01590 [Bdellovibrio sp. CG22_combo_CG10-13_8_21_14_all_39_27]PIR34495.1 MAG: hypothetical protein COV37_12840 [Bdellovibrio sp. CG11_big_fil_rev_8_21_14_0_20_39_38]